MLIFSLQLKEGFMGNQDQTEKMLLDFNDEFAEVFSVLAFKNKIKINPERLQDAATEYHHCTT